MGTSGFPNDNSPGDYGEVVRKESPGECFTAIITEINYKLMTTSYRIIMVGTFLLTGIHLQAQKTPLTGSKKSFRESFVKISKENPFYFELSNGDPFIVNGPCLASAPDMTTMKGYLRKISENGGNFGRVWLSSGLFEIEQKYGEYDAEKLRNIDSLISWAARYNIKLKLCLEHFRQITTDTKASFNKPQYHTANGGPFNNMDEYINTDKGKEVFLRKVRFLKSRYGDNPAVFGWELWNEMNGIMCNGLRAWNDTILPLVHRIFPENLVLQSLGSFDMESRRPDYKYINKLPSNDVAQIHRYIDAGAKLDICTSPMDVLSSEAMDELRSYELFKPMLLAEVGAVLPNHAGPSELYPLDKEGILLHDMLFAPFFSGAAGTGNPWHWDKYIDKNDLWYHFARFAECVKGLNPIQESFVPVKMYNRRLRIYLLAGKNNLLIWCRDTQNDWKAEFQEGRKPELVENQIVDLSNLVRRSDIKRIRFYDPWKNCWTHGSITNIIRLPAFQRSLVIKIEKSKLQGKNHTH
jgi:hypothetical protein